jgi:hypothetical protein
MLRQGLGLVAFALAVGPAFAGDLPVAFPASPPASGSPIYSPNSMIAGDVSLAFGWTGSNSALDKNSFSGLAAGRVNIPFGKAWNEELEASGLFGFSNSSHVAGVFSHTYYKNQAFAAGVLLGASGVNIFSKSSAVYTAGVEGVVFMPRGSVAGKVAYNSAASIPSFWTFGAEGRYYFNSNTKVTGGVSYSPSSMNGWLLSAALEHRWTGTPFTGFTSVGYMPSSAGDRWALLVGFRYLFDQKGSTLQSHDFEVPFSGITQGMQF